MPRHSYSGNFSPLAFVTGTVSDDAYYDALSTRILNTDGEQLRKHVLALVAKGTPREEAFRPLERYLAIVGTKRTDTLGRKAQSDAASKAPAAPVTRDGVAALLAAVEQTVAGTPAVSVDDPRPTLPPGVIRRERAA